MKTLMQLALQDPEGVVGYTVYLNPSDHPGKYVLRRWVAGRDGRAVFDREPTFTIDSAAPDAIYAVRDAMPPGVGYLGRMKGDDPVIVESWL